MTTFVHCRGCGEKIHESAPTCPKCGAPQALPTAVSLPTLAASNGAGGPASAYGAVPWFRRRWLIILCLLTVSPIAGVLSLTGPLYFLSKSEVKVLPSRITIVLCMASVGWVFQFFSRVGSSMTAWYGLTVTVLALVIGFKNQWPNK